MSWKTKSPKKAKKPRRGSWKSKTNPRSESWRK